MDKPNFWFDMVHHVRNLTLREASGRRIVMVSVLTVQQCVAPMDVVVQYEPVV